jgi:glycosyltransferase involved in cell wall biosynthesis
MNPKRSIDRICILPRPFGVGGMVSFQDKLVRGLTVRGIKVCQHLEDRPYDAILIIGGTRHIVGLMQARRRGIPIIQRLDGMNWLHRRLRTGLRHFVRAEYSNWLLSFIRSHLAHAIVYQSEFVRGWWERVYGPTPVTSSVVLNGVDLNEYTPIGPGQPPEDRYRLLMVEGTLGGGYELGLDHAIAMANDVAAQVQLPVELMVLGRVAPFLRERLAQRSKVSLYWAGLVPRDRIPEIDRTAHLLFAADLNPACPNAVVEAMACGLPVIAFDTGALSELVTGDSGRLAPYGGDPWVLDPPNITGLVQAALEVLKYQARFRAAARLRAETALGLDLMVEGYLKALEQA